MLDTYENTEEWEELLIMVYREYYLQREQVLGALEHGLHNPFRIGCCAVSEAELQRLRGQADCNTLLRILESQN